MAIKTNFTLHALKLDLSGYERELRDEMTEEIKDAARDWLQTVIAIVPVWSRASRATFKPLADAVGFALPTGQLVAKEDRSDLGESVSSGGIDVENNSFHFTYETNLSYLADNEFTSVSKGQSNVFAGLRTPTPYGFTAAGAAEFLKRIPEVPSPFEFLRASKI